MTIDIFYNTGFDIINIPCNPEMLYREYANSKKTYENVNIVQSDWLANITIEDEDLDWNRDADYVIITDEKTRTCYTVDSYEMLSEHICRFYLVLDPYNTAGGMEPINGHEPMIVLSGSANRLSVPINADNRHFKQAEDNTFFTLDEPFSPSGRLHMHYDAVPLTPFVPGPSPIPVPPTPTPIPPTPGSTMNSKVIYITEEDTGSGTQYEDVRSGTHIIKECMFLNPAGYKFKKWIDPTTEAEYSVGETINLNEGQVLILKAIWEQIEVAAYKNVVNYSYTIHIEYVEDLSQSPPQPMTWKYSKENKDLSYEGFRILVTSVVGNRPHSSIATLDINDTNLQACFREIEEDIAGFDLTTAQRNAIEADFQSWKGQLSKFFDWINGFIILNTTIGNISHIKLANVGNTNIVCNRNAAADTLNSSVFIGVINSGVDTLYPWLGYPDPFTDVTPGVLDNSFYNERWDTKRNAINENFNAIRGNAMINYFKDAYYTDGRVYYSQSFELNNPLTYTIPDTAWPDEERLVSKWNTMPDGSGTDYSKGQVITLYGGQILDLYPIWQ